MESYPAVYVTYVLASITCRGATGIIIIIIIIIMIINNSYKVLLFAICFRPFKMTGL